MALNKGEVASEATAGDEVELMSFASGEQTALTVAPEATAHIARLLTEKLYNFPVAATVRETISNAIDATNRAVAAGAEFIPVEVQTPNPTSPFFIVTDRGTGMSATDMTNIFSSVGLGTKRGDFAQIGAWGLGSRAPLSYVSAYTITSTQDGITTSVEVNQPNGVPGMRVLSSTRTGLPNGTVVTVPVKNLANDAREFESAIFSYKLFSFANPIRIDDVVYSASDEYLPLGQVALDEETNTLGAVYARKASIGNLVSRVASEYADDIRLGYSLGGGYYASPQTNSREGIETTGNLMDSYRRPDIMVDLVPGVVDFSSSRDEITRNDRSEHLFNNVLTALSNKDGFLDRALASIFPSMSDDYVHALLGIGSPVENEDGSVTYTPNRRALNYGSTLDRKPVTLPRNLFTVSSGRNLIDDIVKYKGKFSVRTMLRFGTGIGAGASLGLSYLPKADSFAHTDDSLMSANAHFFSFTLGKIKAAAVEGFLAGDGRATEFSPVSSAKFSLMDAAIDRKARFSTRVYLIETKSVDTLSKIINKRKVLTLNEKNANYVEFALINKATDVSDDEIAAVQTVSNGNITISRLSVEEFFALDKAHRAAQRVSRESVAREVSVNMYRISDGVDSHAALITASMSSKRPLVQDATVALSKVTSPVFVVVNADYNGNLIGGHVVKHVLNGMYHKHGDAVLNRPVYAVSRPSKAAVDYLDKASGGMVGFHDSVKTVGAQVTEYANDHRFGRDVEADVLSSATGRQLTLLVSHWYSINHLGNAFQKAVENKEHKMYRVFSEDHVQTLTDFLGLLNVKPDEQLIALQGTLSRQTSMSPVRDRLTELYGAEYLDSILALGEYARLFVNSYHSNTSDSRAGVMEMVKLVQSGAELPAELSTPVIEFARRDVTESAAAVAAALNA